MEILRRLQTEMPLAIYRGLLLGVLGDRIAVHGFASAAKDIALLLEDCSQWVASLQQTCMEDAREPAPRSGRDLWASARTKIFAFVQGSFANGNSLYSGYALERLDPEHHYGETHNARGLTEWKASGEPEYFAWLAQRRLLGAFPGHTVAYLRPEQASQFRVKITNGKLSLGETYPWQWRKRIATEGARLLFTIDRANRMHAAIKEETEFGMMHHCSFTAGAAVRVAGFMQVEKGGVISEISSESGHYRPECEGCAADMPSFVGPS